MRNGFSLIELLCVLGLIGLLASFVYPTYTQYLVRAHRLVGQSALLDLAARLEQYHARVGTYQTATLGTGKATDVLDQACSLGHFYHLDIIQATQMYYTLKATPIGSQAQLDTQCKYLTLDADGHAGPKETCWGFMNR